MGTSAREAARTAHPNTPRHSASGRLGLFSPDVRRGPRTSPGGIWLLSTESECCQQKSFGGRSLRRSPDIGGWVDQRLRTNGGRAQGPGRMVRRFNVEGTLSRRRQEDHGLWAKSTVQAVSTSSCHLAVQRLPPANGFTVMTTECWCPPDN